MPVIARPLPFCRPLEPLIWLKEMIPKIKPSGPTKKPQMMAAMESPFVVWGAT